MAQSTDPDPILIAAAVIVDDAGRYLLVRKRGTAAFMQPGGKIEPGEPAWRALSREVREELGVAVEVSPADYLGRASAPAANEPGRLVVAELFRVTAPAAFEIAAEIEEYRWVHPDAADGVCLAPLTRDHVLGGGSWWSRGESNP